MKNCLDNVNAKLKYVLFDSSKFTGNYHRPIQENDCSSSTREQCSSSIFPWNTLAEIVINTIIVWKWYQKIDKVDKAM